MKKIILPLLSLVFLFAACASKKNLALTSAANGSSFDKAVVINETHERQGIDAEYVWIAKAYPGAKTSSQELVTHNKNPYDILHIITANGKAIAVYFDISNFYGKF